MILTIANTKGGVGKTTTAMQLALYRMLKDKKDILLIDGDTQRTAYTAISVRTTNPNLPTLVCSSYPDGRSLIAQVRAQKSKYDDVIIDIGGTNNEALRAALLVSDVLLIPLPPHGFDLWALAQVQGLIVEARKAGASCQAKAFISMAEVHTSANDEAKEMLGEFKEIELLEPMITRRKIFWTASGQGLSVLETRPKDAKAVNEIKQLSEVLFN